MREETRRMRQGLQKTSRVSGGLGKQGPKAGLPGAGCPASCAFCKGRVSAKDCGASTLLQKTQGAGHHAYLPHSLEMVLIELTVSVTDEGDRPASELSLIVGDFVPVTFTCWPRYWPSLMLSAARST